MRHRFLPGAALIERQATFRAIFKSAIGKFLFLRRIVMLKHPERSGRDRFL